MKFVMKDFHDGIETMLRHDKLKTVTVFCSPLSNVTQRVRVTRKYKDTFVVTFGKPNYSEREFLSDCKRAKCNPRRLWLKFLGKKRK
jgi:hypothetical protein